VLVVCLVVSCATMGDDHRKNIACTCDAEKYILMLSRVYPERFTIKQKIILTVGGLQYDFIGYLAVWKGNAFRAVAFGDMGGKFVDLLFRDGRLEIVKSFLPENERELFREGVLYDILHLYMFRKQAKSFTCLSEGRGCSLYCEEENGKSDQYVFDVLDVNISSRTIVDGKVIREVTYEWREGEDRGAPDVPYKIRLVNHYWHYNLEIEVLEFKPRIESERIFESANAGERRPDIRRDNDVWAPLKTCVAGF
jgi:hypothetical protein